MALRKKPDEGLRVVIVGAGKVGTLLARVLRRQGLRAQLYPVRKGLPKRILKADLVILAVRDPQIEEVARELLPVLPERAIVVHTAGAFGAAVLKPIAHRVKGVAQMHPLFAFATKTTSSEPLVGTTFLVTGDAVAIVMVKKVVKKMGGIPLIVPKVDHARYHAAAALLANGSATLAALAMKLMINAGIPQNKSREALAALLRSVAANLETVGVPALLTGPVRRGDIAAVERQAALFDPGTLRAFLGLLPAQVELARAIGDADPAALRAIAQWGIALADP